RPRAGVARFGDRRAEPVGGGGRLSPHPGQPAGRRELTRYSPYAPRFDRLTERLAAKCGGSPPSARHALTRRVAANRRLCKTKSKRKRRSRSAAPAKRLISLRPTSAR